MQGLFILTFVFMSDVHSIAGSLEDAVTRRVESSRLKKDDLGLIIARDDGTIIYKLNDSKKFIPASLTKIVTAAAVLEKLPAGYQFVTELKAKRENVKSGRLEGDIYLRGGGDAGFVSESMWFLVNEFTRSGIKEITGNIIVDDSRFDSVRFDGSRDQQRVDRAYDAPIGAMTFNWSAVNIFMRPGAKVGDPVLAFADPENRYIRITNRATTAAMSQKAKIEVTNLGLRKDSSSEEIVVEGRLPLGQAELVAYKSITRPEIWAGYQLYEFLKQRGIRVSGEVKAGLTPPTALTLAQSKSRPISELVGGMMKFSNNYIAEILTKNLAVEITGGVGTMDKGIEVLRAYLKECGIVDAEIYNPSGLSRQNSFRPSDLLKVLQRVQSNFRVYPEFLASLPVAGVDGTLKRRLGDEKLNGQVRAKTGHLSGIAGLGGFVSGSKGRIYTFVFLYNGGADTAFKSQDLFDKIVLELLKMG